MRVSDPAALVLLHVLPLAAGAAVSPALLGASLEILAAFGRRGLRMLLLYLLGVAVVVAALIALATVLPERPRTTTGIVSDVVNIVLGGLLLVLAIVLLVRRPSAGSGGSGGRSERLLNSRWAGLGVFGLGVFMMVTNFSTLVLVLAGAHELDSGAHDILVRVLGAGMLALGALLPVLLPLVWVAASPTAATRRLHQLSGMLARHGRTIGSVICALTAVYLLLRGFGIL